MNGDGVTTSDDRNTSAGASGALSRSAVAVAVAVADNVRGGTKKAAGAAADVAVHPR